MNAFFVGWVHNINNAETYSNHVTGILRGKNMGMKKKKDNKGPMPAASAGLLRFFEEETEGVKIRPELLMIFSIGLIVVSIVIKII